MPGPVCKTCGEPAEALEDGLCSRCQSVHAKTLAQPVDAKTSPAESESQWAGATQLGEYELLEEVGRGGMGVIYKARHQKLNRIAAIKMILGGRFSSSEEIRRFQVEAEAAAQLDHPCIVPVYEIGEVDGQAFFAMKFIEGGSLADRIDKFQANPRDGIILLAKVARAVHHAHQRGVLHRDLKPANILIDKDDGPLITDLGLAKNTTSSSNLTDTGAVLGTPSYMPPEQASGKSAITTAVDVYALGAIMYELLTGRPPYRGETALATVMQVLEGPAPAPHELFPAVDRDLERVCLKCLDHDPDARYASARELAQDLEAWLAGKSISIKAPSSLERVASWFRRNRRLSYVLFTILMGLLLTLPFALPALTRGNELRAVYSQFPEGDRPLIFSLAEVPLWVTISLILILALGLWPSIGFLNAIVSQPKSYRGAVRAGTQTSLALLAVFSVLVGWMPLIQETTDEAKLHVLTNAIWQPEGKTRDDTLRAVNQMFPGMERIQQTERADAVANRIVSDQFARAPVVILGILLTGVAVGIPVVYGTLIAYALLQRGTALWLCFLRYALAWGSFSCALLVGLSRLGNESVRINSEPVEFQYWWLIVAFSLAAFWLTVRRWNSPGRTN